MSMITNVTNETWETEVAQAKGLIIVDFWAEWCGPCRNMNPILEALAIKFDNSKIIVDNLPVRFAKVNIDHNQALAQENKITTIPNLVFFRNGEKVHEVVGSTPFGVLKETIENIALSLV